MSMMKIRYKYVGRFGRESYPKRQTVCLLQIFAKCVRLVEKDRQGTKKLEDSKGFLTKYILLPMVIGIYAYRSIYLLLFQAIVVFLHYI